MLHISIALSVTEGTKEEAEKISDDFMLKIKKKIALNSRRRRERTVVKKNAREKI